MPISNSGENRRTLGREFPVVDESPQPPSDTVI